MVLLTINDALHALKYERELSPLNHFIATTIANITMFWVIFEKILMGLTVYNQF